MNQRNAISHIWIIEWKNDNSDGWDWEPYHKWGEAKLYFSYLIAKDELKTHWMDGPVKYRVAPYERNDSSFHKKDLPCVCVAPFNNGICMLCGKPIPE